MLQGPILLPRENLIYWLLYIISMPNIGIYLSDKDFAKLSSLVKTIVNGQIIDFTGDRMGMKTQKILKVILLQPESRISETKSS